MRPIPIRLIRPTVKALPNAAQCDKAGMMYPLAGTPRTFTVCWLATCKAVTLAAFPVWQSFTADCEPVSVSR